VGFEPTTPNLGGTEINDFNVDQFKQFLYTKYCRSYASQIFNFTLKHGTEFLDNPSKLLTLKSTVRNGALKSVIALAKFRGEYSTFHEKIKAHGIKWTSTDALTSFSGIFNNNHHNLIEWYNELGKFLKPSEKLWLKYLALSGLRRSESVMSFNRIIQMGKDGNLDEYISELGIVEHFHYKEFLRGTKNAFISIVPSHLIDEIKTSEPMCWNSLKKRMYRRHMKHRFKELRSYYASFMVKNGLISEEADLLEARVSRQVFVRSYLKENMTEFRDRVLVASAKLEPLLK
jgi:hypothetical protein